MIYSNSLCICVCLPAGLYICGGLCVALSSPPFMKDLLPQLLGTLSADSLQLSPSSGRVSFMENSLVQGHAHSWGSPYLDWFRGTKAGHLAKLRTSLMRYSNSLKWAETVIGPALQLTKIFVFCVIKRCTEPLTQI